MVSVARLLVGSFREKEFRLANPDTQYARVRDHDHYLNPNDSVVVHPLLAYVIEPRPSAGMLLSALLGGMKARDYNTS